LEHRKTKGSVASDHGVRKTAGINDNVCFCHNIEDNKTEKQTEKNATKGRSA